MYFENTTFKHNIYNILKYSFKTKDSIWIFYFKVNARSLNWVFKPGALCRIKLHHFLNEIDSGRDSGSLGTKNTDALLFPLATTSRFCSAFYAMEQRASTSLCEP